MIELVQFEPFHVERMELQPRQKRAVSYSTRQYLGYLKEMGPCVTAIDGENVLGCGGVIEWHMGTGTLWLYVCADIKRHAVRLHRAVARLLETVQLRRIEATTEVDWVESCRWLQLLGFEYEGLMRKYGPFGEDHARFARIR